MTLGIEMSRPRASLSGDNRHLVEAVDVDHEVERLPDRQEVAEDQQLLRLLVALVAETERHDLAAAKRRGGRQARDQPRGTHLAEPGAHRPAEDADERAAARWCGRTG